MSLLRRWLLFVAAVLVVAACAAPVAPDLGLTEIEGTVFDLPGDPDPPLVLSVGMFLIDDSVFDMSASSFIEIEDGAWVGAFTGVVDGGYVIVPPGEEDLPESVLVPAEQALVNVVGLGCDLDIEPEGVQLSVTALFPPLAVPFIVGLSPEGLRLMLTTDGPFDEDTDIEELTSLTWIFADGPVTLTTDADCTELEVDLSLRKGWNQVSFSFDGDKAVLQDAPDAEPFSTAVGGIF